MQEEVAGRIAESVQTIAELQEEISRVKTEALTLQQTTRAEMARKSRAKAALEKKLVDVTAEFGEFIYICSIYRMTEFFINVMPLFKNDE